MEEHFLRWYCKECKKTLSVRLTNEFKENFLKKADFFPYPIIFAHENHFSIVDVDSDFKERGVTVSKILGNLKGDEIFLENVSIKKKKSSKK